MSFDVETALWIGVALGRELCCWPPNDVRVIKPRRLWRPKKGVFGLTEAPRLRWLRIRVDLLECGWSEAKAAPATFSLKSAKNRLRAASVLHVYDGLVCGSGECYEASRRELQKREPLKLWGSHGIRFT